MGRGFGKGKYKKIIKSIYPLTPDGDIQVHNIGKLVHFCQISPTKLIKVAAYVEKKANSDLTKSKFRFVGASMKIFQDLIKGCRKNLNLFSNNILRLVKLLLECSFPNLKIIASETFIQFTSVLDENTPSYPELEGLIAFMLDMCQNQIRDNVIKTRLKQQGLKSIRAYIRVLEMTDELDGFIARYTDPLIDAMESLSTPDENNNNNNNTAPLLLLPAILDNLDFPLPSPAPHSVSHSVPHPNTQPQHPNPPNSGADHGNPGNNPADSLLVSDVESESIHVLATEVLRDLFSRASVSVTSMFKAILRYLECRHRWTPNTFAVYIIQSIYDCLKVQHGQILITLLLQHAELPQHPIAVKSSIFKTIIQFFNESAIISGYFMQILDAVVKNMVSSVEFTAQDQQVAENDSAHLAFQQDMISCLGVLCSKISQQQKLDTFGALCTRLSSSKHVSSSGLSGVVVIFARAILQVTSCTHNFPIELFLPYLRLFQDLSMHNNNDVRIYVQKIFQSVIMPVFSNPHISDPVPDQVAAVIRGTLYYQLKMRVKQAENYVAIFDTLRAMLFRSGKVDLVDSFPLIFSIQKFATKWKKITPVRAYTIHTLVAAYLYCVAYIFKCAGLEKYVSTVLQDREKKGHVCSFVLLRKQPIPALELSSTAEYTLVPLQKKVAVDYVLFDRQTIVDLLRSDGSLSISPDEQFSKTLLRKFRSQTDTMTLKIGDLSSESTIFQAPPALSSSPSSIIPALAPVTEHNLQNNSPNSVVVFSPKRSSSPPDDFDKLYARLDIMSMKRALVVGVPSQDRKHSTSYSDIIANCEKRIVHNEQLATISAVFDATEKISWCTLDVDLSLAVQY
eukprot:Phypoly_transcript_02246.p1 GENE.Phypoly_transcript_02246~~Phypoly_transcript_02246.p1  ORF type:complete len:848 (+),score=75.45 Phypoly_transcript_02246:95-2638(+)